MNRNKNIVITLLVLITLGFSFIPTVFADTLVWFDEFTNQNSRWEWSYHEGTGYHTLTTVDELSAVELGITTQSSSQSYSDSSLHEYGYLHNNGIVEMRLRYSGDDKMGTMGWGTWNYENTSSVEAVWFYKTAPNGNPAPMRVILVKNSQIVYQQTLSVDISVWHTYRIEFSSAGTLFLIDGSVVGQTIEKPNLPQRIEMWVDNYLLGNQEFTPIGYATMSQNQKIFIDWVKFSNFDLSTSTFTKTSAPSVSAIIIDHTSIDTFAELRTNTAMVSKAASKKIMLRRASVGGNISEGLDVLYNSNNLLNRSNWIFYDRGNPSWQDKLSDFSNNTSEDLNLYDIFMMKLCYIDYMANADSYIATMNQLENTYPNKVFVWWTMPIMTSSQNSYNPGDSLSRDSFNYKVRNYAKNNGKILFDIADIESDGQIINGREAMKDSYSSDGGHLNTTGKDRTAKAFWVLIAKISGYNPNATPTNTQTLITSTQTLTATKTRTQSPNPMLSFTPTSVLTPTISPTLMPIISDEWSQDNHDAQHTGYTSDDPAGNWVYQWSFNASDSNGGTGNHFYNAPKEARTIMGGGIIFVPAGEHGIYALNKTNGSQLWNITNTSVNATPVYNNGFVYFGGTDGKIYKVNATSGQVVSTYNTISPVNKSLIAVNQYIYAVTDTGELHKIDSNTMTSSWIYRSNANVGTPAAYSATKDIIIMATNDLYVHAINNSDGNLKWKVKPSIHSNGSNEFDFTHSYPVIAEQHSLVFVRMRLNPSYLQGSGSGGKFPTSNAAIKSYLNNNPGAKNLFALDLDTGLEKFTPAVGYGSVEGILNGEPYGEMGNMPVIKMIDGKEVAYVVFRNGQIAGSDNTSYRTDSHMGEMVLDDTTVSGLTAGDVRFVQMAKEEGGNSYVFLTDEQTPFTIANDTIFNAHWGASESAKITDRSFSRGLSLSDPIKTINQFVVMNNILAASCSNKNVSTHYADCDWAQMFDDARTWNAPIYWIYWNTGDPAGRMSSSAYSAGFLPRYTYVSGGYVIVEGNGGEIMVFKHGVGSVSTPTFTFTPRTTTPTPTRTITRTPTITLTPKFTSTPTSTSTSTQTKTFTLVPTYTNTLTHTLTPVPTSPS